MPSRGQWLWPLAILLSPPCIPAQISPQTGDLPRFVRVEPEALEALALQRKHPVLPPLPSDLKISTTAVLEVIVDEKGLVRSAKPVTVHPRLQEEALGAARQWTFSPPLPEEKAALRIGRINLNFVPSGPGQDPVEIGSARVAAKGDPRNASLHYTLAKLYYNAQRY